MPNDTNSVFQVSKRVNSISNSKIFGKNCDDIKTLVIHDNVNSINSKCLCTLKNLEKIEVAKNNEYFSVIEGVLYNKKNNTLVKLPPKSEISEVNISRDLVPFAFAEIQNNEKRLKISKAAFANCENIEYINFDKDIHIDTIFSEAFIGCKKLKKLFLPEQVYCIEYDALRGCELETLVLPDEIYDDEDEVRGIFGFDSAEEIKMDSIKKASEYLGEQRSSASNAPKSADTENASKKINSNDDASYSDEEKPSKMVEVPDNGMEKQVVSNQNYDNIKIEIPENDNVSKLEKQSDEKSSEKQNAMTVNNPMNAAVISTADSNIQSLMKMFEQEMASKQTIDIKDVQIILLKQQLKMQELQQQFKMQELQQQKENMIKEKEIAELKAALLEKENKEKDQKIISLQSESTQKEEENQRLKEENKSLSVFALRYSYTEEFYAENIKSKYEEVLKKIRQCLHEAKEKIEITDNNYKRAGLPMREVCEMCLSVACNLYDIDKGKRVTLKDLLKKTVGIFKKGTIKALRGVAGGCSSVCHAIETGKSLDKIKCSRKSATEYYNTLLRFYTGEFKTVCGNRVEQLSEENRILNEEDLFLKYDDITPKELIDDQTSGNEKNNKTNKNVSKRKKSNLKELTKSVIKDTGIKSSGNNKNSNDEVGNVDDEVDEKTFADDAKANSSTIYLSSSEDNSKPGSKNKNESGNEGPEKQG